MKSRLVRVLVGLLAGTVALGVALLLAVWIFGRDLPSVQDEDMRLTRTELSPERNAFGHLQEAAAALDWSEQDDERVKPVLEEGLKDSATMDELLSRNEDALAHLMEGLEIGRLRVPREAPGDDLPYDLRAWRRLGQLLRLRALSKLAKGDIRDALEVTFDLLRFGHMAQGAQGGMLPYLMGSGLKLAGLAQLRRILQEETLSAQALEPLVGRLESARPEAQSFREALQADYVHMAAVIDDPEGFYSRDGERFRQDIERFRALEKNPLLSRYVFQRNATKALHADGLRRILDGWDKSCSEIQFPDPGSGKSALLRTMWKPNLVGRVIVEIGEPSRQRTLLAKCHVQTEFSATQALVAVRAYRADRGELPPSGDRLIPDYLAAMPADDFDGQPVRYSREARRVYSVGWNLVDDGGDETRDLVFPLGF